MGQFEKIYQSCNQNISVRLMNSKYFFISISHHMFFAVDNQPLVGQNNDILSKTVITQKQFTLSSFQYMYTNTCKFQKLTNCEDNQQLEIKNLPSIMVGNQIKKVTEIHYGGNVYHIQDTYNISHAKPSDKSSSQEEKLNNIIPQVPNTQSQSSFPSIDSSNKDSDKSSSRKLCIFKKQNGKLQSQKRNTKNIPKNFCKAFLNFLTKYQNRKIQKQKLTNCIHYVKNLIGDRKYYNNPVILKIISSNSCKEFFKMFLEEHAKQWIERSKMDNKKVHLDAIKIYLRLYEKRKFLQGDDDQQQES